MNIKQFSGLCCLSVSLGLGSTQSSSTPNIRKFDFRYDLVKSALKITEGLGGFYGDLDFQDYYGDSVAPLGDLDGDQIPDVAIGAPLDDDGYFNAGAIWIHFLNADGSVKSHHKISGTAGGMLPAYSNRILGSALTSLGDLDGDGITELVASASSQLIYILFLNADGTLKPGTQLIGLNGLGGFTGTLDANDKFGSCVASLGDLDGDQVPDLAVGAVQDDDGGTNVGAMWILFLNPSGSVKSHQKISALEGNFGDELDVMDFFGSSAASLGDLSGDGTIELAVGATGDDDGVFGQIRGAVWILSLTSQGIVQSKQKISATEGGFQGSIDIQGFGSSLGSMGDVDHNGVTDLVVGCNLSVNHVSAIFLHPNGKVKSNLDITTGSEGFPGVLDSFDGFGSSMTSLGDLNGDAIPDMIVGAYTDSDGDSTAGAAWILLLRKPFL